MDGVHVDLYTWCPLMTLGRSKNDEQQCQQASKENHRILANTIQEIHAQSLASTVTSMESMAGVSLPSEHWVAFPGDVVI